MFCRSTTFVFSVCIALLCIVDTRAREISSIKLSTTCQQFVRCYAIYHPGNELIYAIEDGVCRTFVNGCVFGTHNCNRINSGLPVSEPIPREQCIEFCPVCDSIEQSEFQYNQCLIDRETCLTGKFSELTFLPFSVASIN